MNIRSVDSKGFTLVELLIVIVIIAILAAITVVAYNGLTQRANNAAVVSSVESVAKLLRLYKTGENAYPLTSGSYCATTDNDCRTFDCSNPVTSNNATQVSALSAYGTLPASVPKVGSTCYGMYYVYNSAYTLNSVPNPLLISFFLGGVNQDCTQIGGMISVKDNPSLAKDFITSNRSNGNVGTSGMTRCYEMFPSE